VTKRNLLNGFETTSRIELPEIRCVAVEAKHLLSGARLLHLLTDDRENFFSICFRTPPPDSTGVPHILEHSVLSGSKKFPLRDPFTELLKSSMCTFLNAMTYPDRTLFPCSSQNRKDFFNLVDVYCDAVFNPRLDRLHFMQEGHHLDFSIPGDTGSPLTINGVVYNEMKGAYSDPEERMAEVLSSNLFPDSVYGYDSGGDPDRIPDLTYEEFVRFHKKLYHPSNSYIFLYGDIPTEEHLAFLDELYLSRFRGIEIDTSVTLQPRWNRSRSLDVPTPSMPGEDSRDKSAVILGWLTNEVIDAGKTLAMQVLEDYLLGNDAAPLKKALIDSGLGKGLSCSGYDVDRRETLFSVGLKGIRREKCSEVANLIRSTLSQILRSGLDGKRIDASVHRLELASMEIKSAWPFRLMDRVYRSWTAGNDPLYWLRMNEHIDSLRETLRKEPGFLDENLRCQIVDNPHNIALTFYPDEELTSRRENDFTEAMTQRKKGLTAEDLTNIVDDAKALVHMQATTDTPEALASLPRLQLSEIGTEPVPFPTSVNDVSGRPFLVTDVFSNGISYIELTFDLTGLDEDLVALVPLFCDTITSMGAAGLDYSAMADREAACCAGINAHPFVNALFDDNMHCQPRFYISSRCLDRNLPAMLGILEDRLIRTDFSSVPRIVDIIKEEMVIGENMVVARGSGFAAMHAARGLSASSALMESFEGIGAVRQYLKLGKEAASAENLIEKLERIRSFVLNRNGVLCSAIGNEKSSGTIESWLGSFLSALDRTVHEPCPYSFTPVTGRIEGIATSSRVGFTGAALQGVPLSHESAPALKLLTRQLSYGFLWEEIRAKKGAYGASAFMGSSTGTFFLTSFRDPEIASTFDTFGKLFDHIEKDMDLSDSAVSSAVISTIKELDPPLRPATAIRTALFRHLIGMGSPEISEFRERLLSLKATDIVRASTEILRPSWERSSLCVISSREKLEEAAGHFPTGMEITDLDW